MIAKIIKTGGTSLIIFVAGVLMGRSYVPEAPSSSSSEQTSVDAAQVSTSSANTSVKKLREEFNCPDGSLSSRESIEVLAAAEGQTSSSHVAASYRKESIKPLPPVALNTNLKNTADLLWRPSQLLPIVPESLFIGVRVNLRGETEPVVGWTGEFPL